MQVVEDEVNKAQAYRDELLAAMQNQVTTSELLDRHKQYYAQLELLSKVLSFGKAKGQVTVDFTWTDSFRVNKRSSSKSIDFEKNSLLFNIAALHCKFALEKNRKTELGLKDAMKNLIQSACIFF